MNSVTATPLDDFPATQVLARWISNTDAWAASPRSLVWAKHTLLDWVAVTLAGADEPLVRMLIDEYAGTNASPCTVLARGSGIRARELDAALINGAASHALDFDDVAVRMLGHPSVSVIAAALAVSQSQGASGKDLLQAIIVGHEVESRIGDMVLPSHYLHGFHTTATVGTFGAAAAAARLRGLNVEQTSHALGLAATQAAGLKCMFGTMAKPLHAGKAAMNGVMAVQLAARGFTATANAIECYQGFARTLAPQQNPFDRGIDTDAGFAIEATLFKFHAACFLTHAAIEAARLLRQQHAVALESMESMQISVPLTHRGVCDIANPQSGLQVKFSIQHLVALALDGIDTAELSLYSEATAREARYVSARRRIDVTFFEGRDPNIAVVKLLTREGQTFTQSANVGVPATDLDAQWLRLLAKARAIAAPVIGAARFEDLVHSVERLEMAPSLFSLQEAIQ